MGLEEALLCGAVDILPEARWFAMLNSCLLNHRTRALIRAQDTSHKHNTEDLSFMVNSNLGQQFIYLVFTRMPGESYRRRLRSLLLCLCDVFRALMNSLVC